MLISTEGKVCPCSRDSNAGSEGQNQMILLEHVFHSKLVYIIYVKFKFSAVCQVAALKKNHKIRGTFIPSLDVVIS